MLYKFSKNQYISWSVSLSMTVLLSHNNSLHFDLFQDKCSTDTCTTDTCFTGQVSEETVALLDICSTDTLVIQDSCQSETVVLLDICYIGTVVIPDSFYTGK